MGVETTAWTAWGFLMELDEETTEYLGKMVPSLWESDDRDGALTTFVREVAENAGHDPSGVSASIGGNTWSGEEHVIVIAHSSVGEGYESGEGGVQFVDEPSREDKIAVRAVAAFVGYTGRVGRMFGQDVY